jgi:iron complex transport system ATP-binding protein
VTMLDQLPAPPTERAPAGGDALAARAIRAGYGRRAILDDITLAVPRGAVTALVGPNGSGKSTLLKVCSRLLAPSGGALTLDGADLAALGTREIARKLAILPQGPSAPSHLTVRDLVEQGRYPWVGALRMLRRQDAEAIDRAIDLVGLGAFADRDVDTLSGGERQRAWLALALAQETAILALDEPTTFLDIGHQFEVLELVRRLNAERGLTVLMVLHDLNQAATFADRLVVLDGGRIVAAGEPWAILEPDLLRDVFGVHAAIVRDPASGRPVIVPRGSAPRAAGRGM